MMRSISLAVVAGTLLLAASTSAFALDSGGGLYTTGPSAHVTTSLNRAPDYQNASPGFSSATFTSGRGVGVTVRGATNPTNTGSYSASAQVMPIQGGKGYSTQIFVPGRNDPMPIISGRRNRDNYGGLGM